MARIVKNGKVVISQGEILVEGFTFDGVGNLMDCSRAAVRRALWALLLAWLGISFRGLRAPGPWHG